MAIKLYSAPTVEPIAWAEMKTHLIIDDDADQAYVEGLITAARIHAEKTTNRAIIAQTWKRFLDAFPDEIICPRPPLIAVDSIAYVDTDGADQTVTSTVYQVNAEIEPGRVKLDYSQSWPSIRSSAYNPITVQCKCGYAASFTANTTTDVLTVSGRVFTDADIVRLSNSGGTLPAGLAANTDYHVRDVSGQTLKLAATAGGEAIDITDAGSGTNFLGEVEADLLHAIKLIVGHLYAHREPVVIGTISSAVKFAAEVTAAQALLMNHWMPKCEDN